jgi:predicted NBD/HSP70 family sugar kinase
VYDVFELAVGGDARARRLLRDRAAVVGSAAATLIEVLDPELVVIGGGVAAPVDNVAVVREVRDQAAVSRGSDIAVPILPSAFGPHALGIAAGAIMLDAVYRSPETLVPALNT